MSAQIVLVEPEIPQNTGNIARTCVAAGISLHLVKPLGFSLSEKAVRRAGLDYWSDLDLIIWDSFEEFSSKNKNKNLYYVSTKAKQTYSSLNYPEDCMFLFGKETKGLPEEILKNNLENTIRIPMVNGQRSLNLSNSVAIIVYEYLRQKDYPGMLAVSDWFHV